MTALLGILGVLLLVGLCALTLAVVVLSTFHHLGRRDELRRWE